jgi:predicted metal-binding protein
VKRQEKIEARLLEMPLYDYAFFPVKDIIFTQDVRTICAMNDCGMYGRRWVCPPVIGSIEDCIAECQAYEHAFLFSTVTEVADSFDLKACVEARGDHEAITYEVAQIFRQETENPLILSTGCIPCEHCAYPDAPCRHPERAFKTIESHGIMIMQMAAQQGLNYDCGQNIVTYFSLVLYNL